MEVFTLRTCRGRGGCRITIMIPCTYTNTQTPTHIFVHNRIGRKKDDVPEVPPELDIFEDLSELNPGYVYKHKKRLKTRTNGRMGGFLSWTPLRGVRYGLCVPKVFVSVFFLRPVMCVAMEIRFSTRKRSTCWLFVLRMNQKFVRHMREIYPKLSGEIFNGLLV